VNTFTTEPRYRQLRNGQEPLLKPKGSDFTHSLTLLDVLRILKRRRRAAFMFAGAVLALAGLYLTFATRRYAGEATLEFDKRNADVLGLNGTAEGPADSLEYNVALQTQVEILESDTLALQIFKELNLEQTQDYKPKKTALDWAVGLFQSSDPSEANLPFEQAPGRRVSSLKKFHRNLTISPVSGSRMIRVTFFNPDPNLASLVANRLLNDYIDYSFQLRYLATSQATGWLGAQLKDLKSQMQSDQARAAKLQREAEIFGVGHDKHNATLSHLESLDSALATAQATRIVKEAAYRAIQSGDPEVSFGLANSSSMGVAGGGVMHTNELATMQALRAQESEQKAKLAHLNEKYGSRNPQVMEANQQLESVRTSIRDEDGRLAQRAKNDLDIATQTEGMARKVFQEQKSIAERLSDKTIQYEIAANEAASSQDLYEGLRRKLKEAGVMGSLQATNAHIIDPARIPDRPATPRSLLWIAAALVFSLFGGLFVAVLVDTIDRTVTSMNEIESVAGLPALGFVPRFKTLNGVTIEKKLGANSGMATSAIRRPQLIAERDLQIGECFRSVRTAVLLAGRRQKRPQLIAVSSPLPSEGKTTASLNLALVLAQQGPKVLLVDADMRRGALANRQEGLSTALRTGSVDSLIMQSAIHENLYFLASGPQPQYPADLLGSVQMSKFLEKWRAEYQFVIIDTPPVLPVTDTLVLAPHVDGVLLVARQGMTSREALLRTSALLSSGGAHILGVLLNAIDTSSDSEYSYYGHENYSRSTDLLESRT
jgi:polysaccharide biosynthesis transport protein